jgi:hypothetical protein
MRSRSEQVASGQGHPKKNERRGRQYRQIQIEL